MSERWRKIPGWPYEASTLGRVRSMPRTMPNGAVHGGQVLEPREDKDGYLRVTLTDSGRRGVLGVHQAVALAWHGKPEVRHLNGDPQDNRPGNLAWGSRRVNELEKQRESRNRTDVSHPSDGVAPVAGEQG